MGKALELEYTESVINEIADFKKYLDGFEDGSIHEEEWQKRRLWQGIYGQRQPDVQMIRIKFPYGLGTTDQFREVAQLSRDMTNSIIHITTRAALQMHFIPREMTPELIDRLAKAGLTSREACGNVVRNVTATPYAAITPEQVYNVIPLAEKVFVHCLRNPYSQNFPRKFKISFSGSEQGDHGLSYMHDIGYVASQKDGEYTVNVYAGGGLGGRPVGADLIAKDMPLEHILIGATALMRIFNEYGNRSNRNKARMKFIKLEWGLEKFIEEYNKEFDKILNSEYGQSLLLDTSGMDLDLPKASADKSKLDSLIEDKEWLKHSVFEQNEEDVFGIRVRIDSGDLTADQMDALCEIADEFGRKEIRSTASQNLMIPYINLNDVATVYGKLKDLGLNDHRFYDISNVVACPGRSTCNLSVTSSKGLGSELIELFKNDKDASVRAEAAQINISGCHNGCGQHALGTIGFNGSSRMVGGKAVPCAILSVGGGARDGIRSIARRVGRVAAKKAPEAVKALLSYYRENAPEGQGIQEYMASVDVKELKPILKPFDVVEDFEDRPDLYLDYEMQEGDEYTPAVGQGECAGGVLNLVTEALDDSINYLNMADIVREKGFFGDVVDNTKSAVRHCLRAALIEAGETIQTFEEIWDAYNKFFKNNDNLPAKPEQAATITTEVSEEEAVAFYNEAKTFVDSMKALYREDNANFKPRNVEDETVQGENIKTLDLKGVPCPMNYVKAKLTLEMMEDGDNLEVIIDSGEPFRNVPNSLKLDGHKIVQLEPINDNEQYSLIVTKNGEA